jgi:hypothetical protein
MMPAKLFLPARSEHEMLVVMLEKHGIQATQEFDDPNLPDETI